MALALFNELIYVKLKLYCLSKLMNSTQLQVKAQELRKLIIKTIYAADFGYLGASLSCLDILVALYHGKIDDHHIINYDAKKPGWDKQDFFVMSKIEGLLTQYAVLADLGFFDVDNLQNYASGAGLKFTPNRKVPGILHTAGGHADSVAFAVGLAASLKREKASNMVYALCADYELQKGIFWESLLMANQYKCDNLVLIIEDAGLQPDGFVKGLRDVMPIQQKIEAFGFKVIQILNGHDYAEILDAIARAWRIKRQPVCLWTHTVSGYGIPFASKKPGYFTSGLSDNEFKEALKILKDNR